MAWSWFAVAAKSIPWGTILRRAPDIIDAANSLLATHKTKRAADEAKSQTEVQLVEIRERLSYLEDHEQETAKVVNQLAQQTQDLTNGIQVLAAKIRLLTILFGATLILAAVAVAISISP